MLKCYVDVYDLHLKCKLSRPTLTHTLLLFSTKKKGEKHCRQNDERNPRSKYILNIGKVEIFQRKNCPRKVPGLLLVGKKYD